MRFRTFLSLIVSVSLLLFFHFASAAEGIYESDSIPFANETEQIREIVEEEKWEYLGEQWKAILLRNSAISFIDSVLRTSNPIIFFILGISYDLTFSFFFSFLLWVFFLIMFAEMLQQFGTFRKGVSFVVSLLVVVILGHAKVFVSLSEVFFRIAFFREGIWRWASFGIFLVAYLITLIYSKSIVRKIGRKIKKQDEETEKQKDKLERDVFHKRVEGVENAFDDIGDALR